MKVLTPDVCIATLLLRLLLDSSKKKTHVGINLYFEKKKEALLIVKGKIYKGKLHS